MTYKNDTLILNPQDQGLSNPENFPEKDNCRSSVSLHYEMKAAKERNNRIAGFEFGQIA